MTSFRSRAFAKLNLSLKILAKRPDGFHDIETLMQNISLYDDISVADTGDGIVVSCDDPAVPSGEGNICHKAAKRMMDISGKKGVSIDIKKNIPSGAGLGGGSSDAAAVLNALNGLWDIGLSRGRLIEIAAELGSDVPFFIEGGRAFCTGRGEIVRKLPDESPSHYVIIKPDESVPTKWAYEEYDSMSAASGFSCFGSKEGGIICTESPRLHYENDFEKVILPKFPGIKRAKEALLSAGAGTALLTGSGSAVFGVFEDQESAEKALTLAKETYVSSYIVHSVDRAFHTISSHKL